MVACHTCQLTTMASKYTRPSAKAALENVKKLLGAEIKVVRPVLAPVNLKFHKQEACDFSDEGIE